MNMKAHKAARPMKVVRDKMGNEFLCDKAVTNLKEGLHMGVCIPDERLAFTRND